MPSSPNEYCHVQDSRNIILLFYLNAHVLIIIFQVRAETSVGHGPWSDISTVTTDPGGDTNTIKKNRITIFFKPYERKSC